jgi:hypothetical protein
MKNFIKWLGIIALAAVIGFSFAACGGDDGGDGAGSVDGTYNSADGEKLVLNNGSFTFSQNGVDVLKGTYTASGNNITMTVTQINGAALGEDASDIGLSTSKWYTEQQLKTETINYFKSEGMTQAQAEAAFNEYMGPLMSEMFITITGTLNGNTLTLDDGSAYTKQGGSNPNPGGGGGGGSDSTWKAAANSTFGDKSINAITYGGGKFVAVGNDGKMAYSSDGATWTAVTNSTFGTDDINAIIYANGKFVAGGDHGTIATSADGASWTSVTTTAFDYYVYGSSNPSKGDINGIAWGGAAGQEKFVAVAGGGAFGGNMAYSTDGVNWTAIPDSILYIYGNTIVWGGGKFVGGGGSMAYSPNGIDWTKVVDSTFGIYSINTIIYANGKFVAGGELNKMATSSDGVTWTAARSPLDVSAIAYGGGKFVAVGDTDSRTAYSADGVTWTAITSTAFDYQLNVQNQTYTVQYNLRAIAYGSGKFVVGGVEGKIWYSSGL